MNDSVNHPSHYIDASVMLEPIELTSRLDSCIGQAIQYVMRAPYKGTEEEDLKKAVFYLKKSKELIIPWTKYRNQKNIIYVLAKQFANRSKDPLTRNVLNNLFFSDIPLNHWWHGGQDSAIDAINKRLQELEK